MKSIKRQRGFASFSAVVLVGTTAIALTALASVTILQVQRSRDAATDAQLRQLLIAGQTYLEAQANSDNDLEQFTTPVPDTLIDAEASLTIALDSKSETATITATHQNRQASTTLVYDA